MPVAITHFISRAKPWNDAQHLLHPRLVLPLRSFLAQHFPDHPAVPVARAKDISAGRMYQTSLKNLDRIRRYKPFFDRFPDDLLPSH